MLLKSTSVVNINMFMKRLRWFVFFLFFVVGFFIFTPVWAIDVPNYGVFELTLTATEDYSNPYLLMPGDNITLGFVVGTFTGTNGEIITIDGFWDGGKTWKIRMSPISVGTWNYSTSSTDTGLDGVTGSFNSIPSNNKGFVRVDTNHPHHFIWDDGTPFYWAPATTMIAHFDDNPSFPGRDAQGGARRIDDGTFQALADIRVMQGFNTTHWGYFGFNKPFFSRREQRNEGGTPFTNYDPDFLNPLYHQFGDQRVQALLDRGIIPQFQLGWPDQNILSNIGHARLKRYWRYLIARYTAYNITYNLFGEVEEFGSSYRTIVNDYGNLTKAMDPYDHLLTTHSVGGLPSDVINQPWMDYIMLQLSTSSTSNYLSYNKPVINAEYGGYEVFQVTGEELRPMIWDISTRGGYFVYENWGDDLQSSGTQYSSLNNLFFRDQTSFWLLEYHPELFGGKPGLANPGQEYVIYLPSGGSVTVDLSAASGNFNVEWYNPRTGVSSEASPTTGGASRSFTAPDTNDWVLHIGGPSSSDSTPPTTPQSTSAIAINKSQIDLTWQAASDPESGISNYKIYRDGLLLTTHNSQLLTHSDTGLNQDTTYSYEVSAVNGAGLESVKSTPASATTLKDTTPPSPPTNVKIGQLVVSNPTVGTGKTYEIIHDSLDINTLQYIDHTAVFTSVPSLVTTQTYIKTANDDKYSTGTDFISFEVNHVVEVYIAHDDRITSKPNWLSSFTDTGEDLVGLGTFSMFVKEFPAGMVTLGGNTVDGQGDHSMYTVVIK